MSQSCALQEKEQEMKVLQQLAEGHVRIIWVTEPIMQLHMFVFPDIRWPSAEGLAWSSCSLLPVSAALLKKVGDPLRMFETKIY
jgi:hypothetical protein